MLNKFSVIYILLASSATLISLAGAYAGYTAKGRNLQSGPEERHRIEQRLYLAFSALGLGLIIKLTMAPGWFFMLQSLIPAVPGAMCLVGVHQNVPVISWLASSLKVILPMLYATWLILSLIDRQIITQPYLHLRANLLLPLALLIVFEIGIDLVFLLSLKPVQVNCCTIMLDSTSSTELSNTIGHTTLFIGCTLLIALVLIALLLRKSITGKAPYAILTLLSVVLPLAQIAVLHSRLTKVQLPAMFVNTSYHHCIFCSLQGSIISQISLLLTLCGSTIALAIGVSVLWGIKRIEAGELEKQINVYRKWAVLMIGAGVITMLV